VIVTVSHHTAAEIVERYGVGIERIVVAPNGIPRSLLDAGSIAPRPLDRPYVMALGGASKRNPATAVAAWQQLRRRGHDLTLVLVNEPRVKHPDIVGRDQPDDATLGALLAHAELLLYPTGFEGFGMPALEAAALGTPVVCARVGALPEVLGSAAAWADDLTATRLADAAERVLVDAGWAEERKRLGRERASTYATWDASVAGHVLAWRRAAG
jgi:glycosyltransferase involved in cell wall biosynthesis